MSQVAPLQKAGRIEYDDASFDVKSPFFSNLFFTQVVNSTDDSVLIPAFPIYYNRWGNEISCFIPRISIADIGVAGYLYIRGNWPVPVQTFVGGNTQCGACFVEYVPGTFTPAIVLLQSPNANQFLFLNTGATGAAANASVNVAQFSIRYFIKA